MTHVNLTVRAPQWDGETDETRKAWYRALDQSVTNLGQITAWAVEGVPGDEDLPQYDWVGWEAEPETTGDGSGDPEKHFLTIRDPSGEELALIVHRTVGGKFPLDGEVADEKITNADMIVSALNKRSEAPKRWTSGYSVEMGVDIDRARVHTLTVSPFETKEAAEQFARIAKGVEALDVKAWAEKAGVPVDYGDLGDAEMKGRTIAGAALVDYTGSDDDPKETDLY